EADQVLQEGRLPRARAAEDREDLAALDREGDAEEDLALLVEGVERIDADRRDERRRELERRGALEPLREELLRLRLEPLGRERVHAEEVRRSVARGRLRRRDEERRQYRLGRRR